MIPRIEIINFYRTLRRYRDHDTVLELLKDHFRFKLEGRMTEQEFSIRVESIIEHALKAKKG